MGKTKLRSNQRKHRDLSENPKRKNTEREIEDFTINQKILQW